MDPQHQLPTVYYVIPSIGISIGGQFFVFFQMFFAYTSDVSDFKNESSDVKFYRFIIAEVNIFLLWLKQAQLLLGAAKAKQLSRLNN